jgi:hypothetical protein
MKKDGVFNKCAERIKLAEQTFRMVIDADELSHYVHDVVSLRHISRHDLEMKYVKAMVAVCLYQRGWRSVVRGKGKYVNYELCSNPAYMAQVAQNKSRDIKADKEVLERLKEAARSKGIDHQMVIRADGSVGVEMSLEEILSLLEREA